MSSSTRMVGTRAILFLPARAWLAICLAAASLLVLTPNVRSENDDDFFETRVRPLLVKHCEECHGAKKAEGGLRLDSRDAWLRGGDRGAVLVAGKPEESLLIRAVRHTDSELEMPPDGKLSAAEIADLETWIKRGAVDPRRESPDATQQQLTLAQARSFWSFQAVKKPAVPRAADDHWSRTPIDAFVWQQQQKTGVLPVADADRRTLARRATLDLTGLPPTPAEIDAFVADQSENAFAALVDRLLASPAYGERWGRHWLDVARYADTAGDGADYPVREAGKYRDWVIAAMNADLPYDQFLREQISGDILAREALPEISPQEYARLVTATGFLAIGKRYGYKPSPDFEHLDFADAIDSLGRSVLGLSLGCARCHNHKYDPISAADYYAIYGIFKSTKWAFPGGEEHQRPADFLPLVPPATAAQLDQTKAEQLAQLDREISALELNRKMLDPKWFAGGIDLDLEAQAIGKPPGDPWFHAGPIEILAEAQSPFAHVHGSGTRGVRVGSGQSHDGLRYVFPEKLRATPDRSMHFTIDFRTVAEATQKGAYRFYLGRGVVESLAIECSVTPTEFAIRSGSDWEVIRRVEPGTWYTLRLTIDPAKKTYAGIIATASDSTAFEGKKLGAQWDGVIDCFICDGIGHVAGAAAARDLDNLGLQVAPFGKPGDVAPDRKVASSAVNPEQLDAQIKSLTERRTALASQPVYDVAYGVSEAAPVNVRIQQRGEPERLGDEVPRRFLEVLGGETVPANAGSGRKELADWLTRPTNPLTARVLVNRVWQWHFGQGLVTTPSDFGVRGEQPSHPELLDYLASEFMVQGWSMKWLHRQIMLSRTYQLASADHAENLQKDPGNRWLWRFSRRRLDAESIRDSMLAVSGGLDRSEPQPHPFPAVESWRFSIHNPFFAVYPSNHRSVYLMVQRNRRHPYLALFDAADPNQSVDSRHATTTPPQALFLMNSPFVHEQATLFARRIIASSTEDPARIRFAFETAQGRPPADAELAAAQEFVAAYRQKLAGNSDESPVWGALARVLLTSNAFLYLE